MNGKLNGKPDIRIIGIYDDQDELVGTIALPDNCSGDENEIAQSVVDSWLREHTHVEGAAWEWLK